MYNTTKIHIKSHTTIQSLTYVVRCIQFLVSQTIAVSTSVKELDYDKQEQFSDLINQLNNVVVYGFC